MAVNATAIWRVRPSGVNTNGGGYDPGIAGAATDYSQQNAAQASGTNGSGSATTTFTDATAAAFTSAMVGNAINITGQGTYFVVTFTSATQVVVDRALGTFSGATWHLGGGWADFWTNTTSSGPVVQGNIVYILGSGTPNPSSYTYDYTPTGFTSAGSNAAPVFYANDPGTPGYKAPPDTTGGMPVIKFNVASNLFNLSSCIVSLSGLWIVGATNAASNYVISSANNYYAHVFGCVLDQFSFDLGMLQVAGGSGGIIGSEVFSSATAAAGSAYAANETAGNMTISGCNIHDCISYGVGANSNSQNTLAMTGTIIAKCGVDGLTIQVWGGTLVQNNTIDGNAGNGITVLSGRAPYSAVINNIISNHTGVGKFGISNNTSASPPMLFDYNSFYNNTSNYNNVSAGPHDTALGVTPYVASSTENYTLA